LAPSRAFGDDYRVWLRDPLQARGKIGRLRLLGKLFEFEDLGAKELKGIDGPVGVFAAARASSIESRFDALHTSGLTALVGREEELELLLRRWSRAKTGEGQVVLLSGEAEACRAT
jgi:hypothetical protein